MSELIKAIDDFIKDFGFPVVMSVYLLWFQKAYLFDHLGEILRSLDRMRDNVASVSEALRRLESRVDELDKKN
jgi:hypothetical protein